MKPLTKDQAIVMTGFTEISCIPFEEFQKDVEERLGRPVWTHEFASEKLWEEIKEVYRSDFEALVKHLWKGLE
jgi:hypothetical protein